MIRQINFFFFFSPQWNEINFRWKFHKPKVGGARKKLILYASEREVERERHLEYNRRMGGRGAKLLNSAMAIEWKFLLSLLGGQPSARRAVYTASIIYTASLSPKFCCTIKHKLAAAASCTHTHTHPHIQQQQRLMLAPACAQNVNKLPCVWIKIFFSFFFWHYLWTRESFFSYYIYFLCVHWRFFFLCLFVHANKHIQSTKIKSKNSAFLNMRVDEAHTHTHNKFIAPALYKHIENADYTLSTALCRRIYIYIYESGAAQRPTLLIKIMTNANFSLSWLRERGGGDLFLPKKATA